MSYAEQEVYALEAPRNAYAEQEVYALEST